MIQKKYIILGVPILVLLLVIGVAIFLTLKSTEDKYSIKETSSDNASKDEVKIDTSSYPDLLNEKDKNTLIASMIKRSTYKRKGSEQISVVIRKDSLNKSDVFEKTFIVDVEQLQTSYFVSIYDNPDEDVHIINVACLPKEQQIYTKDYCYET